MTWKSAKLSPWPNKAQKELALKNGLMREWVNITDLSRKLHNMKGVPIWVDDLKEFDPIYFMEFKILKCIFL